MSNPSIVIKGMRNSSIRMVKSDSLDEIIRNTNSGKYYTLDEMKELVAKIENSRASKR